MSNRMVDHFNFISADVTNTRLMGVVGAHSRWRDAHDNEIHVLFHLDFEDYGVDGYEMLFNPSQDEVNYEVQKMMGGLGGIMVSVDENHLRALVSEAFKVNERRSEEIPQSAQIWIPWFSEADPIEDLYDLVCEHVESNVQRIHYAVMRLVGMDRQGFEYVTKQHILYDDYVEEPSLLLKNVVEELEDDSPVHYYLVTSLISTLGFYQIIHWHIVLNDQGEFYKIDYADDLMITGKEAALLLRRDEHLCLFKVLDRDFLETYFEAYKPEMMCNEHENGLLYTAFRSHNHHVKDQTFYLNGDIFAVYYLTQQNELVVSGFDEGCLLEALEEFDNGPLESMIRFEERYELNQSVIYEFVHSNAKTFKKFMENV